MVILQAPLSLSLLIKHLQNFNNMFSVLASHGPLCNETNFTKNSLYGLKFGMRGTPAQIYLFKYKM